MSKSSGDKETQLQQLLPSKIRTVQQFFPLNFKARSLYCRWFRELVSKGILDLQHAFFSDEDWLTLNKKANSQNNRY
jgi:hypothetical protein